MDNEEYEIQWAWCLIEAMGEFRMMAEDHKNNASVVDVCIGAMASISDRLLRYHYGKGDK